MKKSFCLPVFALALVLVSAFAYARPAQETPSSQPATVIGQDMGVVRTNFGQVSGVFEKGLTYYKGVPFAKPPVGNLRWAPPEDPAPWQGVKACTSYAPMSMQILSTTDWYGPEFYYDYLDSYPNMSEDCLYLNITTPAKSSTDKYPVIFWLHGGASMHGYSYEPEFDQEELAKKGVVVVSVAYRLGLFGFLATPEMAQTSPTGTASNYGVLDVIKALEWVNKNIASFGGDPSRITVAGQSAGAGFVSNLLISPLAKGLFQNAFMSTRNINVFGTLNTLESKYASSAAYLEGKGYGKMSLAELRALPTSAFLNRTTEKPEIYNQGFGACIDGYSLPYNPGEVLTKQGGLNGVNVMMGNNSGDGNDTFSIITMDSFYQGAKRTYGELYDKYNFEKLYIPSDDIGATIINLEIQSQQRTTLNTLTAGYLSEKNPNSNMFVFLFTHAPPGREAEIRKAWHSADLWYWFDSMRDIPEQRDWTELDYAIGDMASQYLVNFATTGNPNGPAVLNWPATTRTNLVFMDLAEKFAVRRNFYSGTYKVNRDNLLRDNVLRQNKELAELYK
jgi:para-nitrobenzyl esterase